MGDETSPSTEATVGYERRSMMGGNTRLVSSYQAHPEMVYSAGEGVQVLSLQAVKRRERSKYC